MRIYQHPTKSGFVIAVQDNRSVEVERASIPAIAAEARAYLAALLSPPVIPDFPSPPALTPDGELDAEAVNKPAFDALLDILDAEISFLNANIPGIDSMTTIAQLRVAVKRLAQENLATLKAIRYIANKLAGD